MPKKVTSKPSFRSALSGAGRGANRSRGPGAPGGSRVLHGSAGRTQLSDVTLADFLDTTAKVKLFDPYHQRIFWAMVNNAFSPADAFEAVAPGARQADLGGPPA